MSLVCARINGLCLSTCVCRRSWVISELPSRCRYNFMGSIEQRLLKQEYTWLVYVKEYFLGRLSLKSLHRSGKLERFVCVHNWTLERCDNLPPCRATGNTSSRRLICEAMRQHRGRERPGICLCFLATHKATIPTLDRGHMVIRGDLISDEMTFWCCFQNRGKVWGRCEMQICKHPTHEHGADLIANNFALEGQYAKQHEQSIGDHDRYSEKMI